MALEPGRRSASPESSGRESPIPRPWRNQLGVEESTPKDKSYRRYAAGVDKALAGFDTALQEWADYISFLNRLLKALQARNERITSVPAKAIVAKRLSQCMNASLPSGVHQKTLEVYNYVFSVIGKDGLSGDLPLYLPGLASTLSFASHSVRSPFLDLLERHLLGIDHRALRPATKSVILALLPGLEEETSDEFPRILKLLERFKMAIRAPGSEAITPAHATGDSFFWQCFFLAAITGQSRRTGALAYLVQALPKLGPAVLPDSPRAVDEEVDPAEKLTQMVTSPEPGLLLRCFAAGLADEQLLIQRGYLDLLVTHLPLHARVLQTKAKPLDLELLLGAAAGVTIRREMSLNRRLWTWLLGPEPVASTETDGGVESPGSAASHRCGLTTSYFEEHGLQPLSRALLAMITSGADSTPAERAKPFRICLSLMDRWEIGGLVVPDVFLPMVDSARAFKARAATPAGFVEVLRSANVFFDGVESGLIYSELVALLAQAVGPGHLSAAERMDKLDLVRFVLDNFNVREEEMITVHAPLAVLCMLCMVAESEAQSKASASPPILTPPLLTASLGIAADLLELVPGRAFPSDLAGLPTPGQQSCIDMRDPDLIRTIKCFYANELSHVGATSPPLPAGQLAQLLLQRACLLSCDSLEQKPPAHDTALKCRILMLALSKTPTCLALDTRRLLSSLHQCLCPEAVVPFLAFSSALSISTHLYLTQRIRYGHLSALVTPLARHAWRFLSASEPKYHVETVRGLWQLQTALSVSSRDMEAALCALMLENDMGGTFAARPAEAGRSLAVLWSHSLQDHVSGAERRASSKPVNGEGKATQPRLSGAEHFHVMLTRPLFLMLDALADERTQLFMTVKSWLNSLVGIDKFFGLFVSKLAALPFLQRRQHAASNGLSVLFTGDDDLDMGIYYLRCLSNVFRWAPDTMWQVLATKTASSNSADPPLSLITGTEEDVSLQEFFVHACLRCIACDKLPREHCLDVRATQLFRSALAVLHQILSNPYAEQVAHLHLADHLIERLSHCLEGPDPYTQVLLLDGVLASLKLRELVAEPAFSPTLKMDAPKGPRLAPSADGTRKTMPPPPALLKCLQAGIGSPSSRTVLDSWVGFLADCLGLYAESIFQLLIPLVESLCNQIGNTFASLRIMFRATQRTQGPDTFGPETTLISLLNALEQVLACGHDRLLAQESRARVAKSPDQPQGVFGNMLSGVFSTDAPQSRSATTNDRLTVLLALQDAVRMCFTIWSWGLGTDAVLQDLSSVASFNYTSLRMRNRARRLLERLFAAETPECLETVIGLWKQSVDDTNATKQTHVLDLLLTLDASRPKHTIPALFHAIYTRTNPSALDVARKSTLTIELQDTDVVMFLVDYARSLEDDAMDEIWQDCLAFVKDLLTNPFPHRHILPSLLEFVAILGEKVDNTNFGEQRKMRRDLVDLFLRLLTAIFTIRPPSVAEVTEKRPSEVLAVKSPAERAYDVVGILSAIVPNLPKILVENDRVLAAATVISANVIGPALRSRSFPDTVSKSILTLLTELSRLPNNQKACKKDVGDAFNDARFFASPPSLVQQDWLPLLKLWTITDKERMPELLARITPPTTAGIVFGVGATSARLEADRKTQLNLRRIVTLLLAASDDAFVTDLPVMLEKLVDLIGATATSSPSSTTRAEVYMVVRALVLKTSAVHLTSLWPVVNAELRAAISSVVAPDHSAAAETYGNIAVLQACKLLDLLVCVAPDDFQMHEWLFVTDTIDAVHGGTDHRAVALVDELAELLGTAGSSFVGGGEAGARRQNHESCTISNGDVVVGTAFASAAGVASTRTRQPLLGTLIRCEDVAMERKDELVAKVLRPFFGQLSIFAFEETYALGTVDWAGCAGQLLKDVFEERSIVRGL